MTTLQESDIQKISDTQYMKTITLSEKKQPLFVDYGSNIWQPVSRTSGKRTSLSIPRNGVKINSIAS